MRMEALEISPTWCGASFRQPYQPSSMWKFTNVNWDLRCSFLQVLKFAI